MKKLLLLLILFPTLCFGAQETMTGGAGITWADEYGKANSNFDELYLQAFTTLGTAADVTFASLTLTDAGGLTVGAYERRIQLEARASGIPADQAPLVTIGTASCMSFVDAGSKYGYFQWEVPTDWVGGENVSVELSWVPESGAVGASETVIHKLTYRSVAEGETITNGTAATASATFTDGGAGTAQYITERTDIAIAYDDANQPLTAGDEVLFQIERDTDTFAGDTCVSKFVLVYNSNSLPN